MEVKEKMTEHSQEEILNSLRKELKITRYCSILVATLLVFVIVGGIYVVNKMTPALTAVQQMQPAIEKIEQLDIEMLNQKIEQLDIEGLNKIVEDLDAEELSETLKNINDATALLREIGEGLGDFSDSVSNSFSDWLGIETLDNNGV
ncbi:MAG: hypothetical protein IJZ23_00480 [Roseburia sp.]|nr:hypothetical protein [Roseburia sp.]